MKVNVRRGVFETNSSNTHSITICLEGEYDAWKDGKLIFDKYNDELVSVDKIDVTDGWRYLTYEAWTNSWELEQYTYKYTTKGGETIVAFGMYGHD